MVIIFLLLMSTLSMYAMEQEIKSYALDPSPLWKRTNTKVETILHTNIDTTIFDARITELNKMIMKTQKQKSFPIQIKKACENLIAQYEIEKLGCQEKFLATMRECESKNLDKEEQLTPSAFYPSCPFKTRVQMSLEKECSTLSLILSNEHRPSIQSLWRRLKEKTGEYEYENDNNNNLTKHSYHAVIVTAFLDYVIIILSIHPLRAANIFPIIHLAAGENMYGRLNFLEKIGADLSVTNGYGKNALQVLPELAQKHELTFNLFQKALSKKKKLVDPVKHLVNASNQNPQPINEAHWEHLEAERRKANPEKTPMDTQE